MAQKQLKSAFKALKKLPTATIDEVDKRLLAGETPNTVAAWLQEEVGVFKELERGSLKKNLERYRAADLKDRVLGDIKANTKGLNVSVLAKKIVAIEEMEGLVEIQKGRLAKALMLEQKTGGILIKTASDEVTRMMSMLSELGKLQLETGVMIRAGKKGSFTETLPDGSTRTVEWSEEQAQLYKQLDGMINKGNVIDAVVEEVATLATPAAPPPALPAPAEASPEASNG